MPTIYPIIDYILQCEVNNVDPCDQDLVWPEERSKFDQDRFPKAWRAIPERATSLDADLSPIIANVLRMSSYQLSQVPQEKRLSTLVRNQPRLPLGILFGLENTRAERLYDMDEVRALMKKSLPTVEQQASWKSKVVVTDVEMAIIGPPAQGQTDSAVRGSYQLNSWVPLAISSEFSTWETLLNINGRLYMNSDEKIRVLIALPWECANDPEFTVQVYYQGELKRLSIRRDARTQATQVNGEKKLCLLIDPRSLSPTPDLTLDRGAELILVDECKVPGTWNPFLRDDFRLVPPAPKQKNSWVLAFFRLWGLPTARIWADWPLLTTVYRGAVDVSLLDERDGEELAQSLYEGELDTENILSIVYGMLVVSSTDLT